MREYWFEVSSFDTYSTFGCWIRKYGATGCCGVCRVLSGRGFLMYEWHGTAPSACTVLLMVSPLRGDFAEVLFIGVCYARCCYRGYAACDNGSFANVGIENPGFSCCGYALRNNGSFATVGIENPCFSCCGYALRNNGSFATVGIENTCFCSVSSRRVRLCI